MIRCSKVEALRHSKLCQEGISLADYFKVHEKTGRTRADAVCNKGRIRTCSVLQGTQREAQQCKYSVRMQAAAPTNQGGKWLHNQAGPQDDQQICLLKVFEALKEALRKVFAKENNVWFY